MEGVRKEDQQGSRQARRLLQPATEDHVLVSYAETARHMILPLLARIEKHGVRTWQDAKYFDPGDSLDTERANRIASSDVVIIVLSSRCQPQTWMELEAAAALSAGVPVLVYLESAGITWPCKSLPTLVTHLPELLAVFLERSRVDAMSIWEFAANFFTDRATARRFQRASSTAWRWVRKDIEIQAGAFELSLVDESTVELPQLRLAEARVEDGQTVLYLARSDRQRYRLAWSKDIRAVIPAPAWPGAPAIGFMHCDFDTGWERVCAGEPLVEMRLHGREVYGWHMSEYFWKVFVGSLPKMLGMPAS